MRKGTRFIELIAFNALFDVSLITLDHHWATWKSGDTHERHQNMVITFSANSYTTLLAFSGRAFGERRNWDKDEDILEMSAIGGWVYRRSIKDSL